MLSQMLQIVDLNDTQNSHDKRNQENENLFKKRILLDKVESGKTALKQIHTSNSFTRAHTQLKKTAFSNNQPLACVRFAPILKPH